MPDPAKLASAPPRPEAVGSFISGLPSAGVGALLVLMMFRMDLSVIAMIGIVIASATGMMALDAGRHRQEKRHHDDRFRPPGPRDRPVGRSGDPGGMLVAFPA